MPRRRRGIVIYFLRQDLTAFLNSTPFLPFALRAQVVSLACCPLIASGLPLPTWMNPIFPSFPNLTRTLGSPSCPGLIVFISNHNLDGNYCCVVLYKKSFRKKDYSINCYFPIIDTYNSESMSMYLSTSPISSV